MRVEMTILYVASVRGAASLIRIRMDAVETAAMLISIARLGGNPGLSIHP